MEEQHMKKEEFIRIRVAGWQKKYISLQAEKAHKSLSQYVRRSEERRVGKEC